MSAGVSRGGKAQAGLLFGRLLDEFDKEKASSAPPGRTFTPQAQNPSPSPRQSVKTGSSLTPMRRLFGDVR
jgi:hypothetical protein